MDSMQWRKTHLILWDKKRRIGRIGHTHTSDHSLGVDMRDTPQANLVFPGSWQHISSKSGRARSAGSWMPCLQFPNRLAAWWLCSDFGTWSSCKYLIYLFPQKMATCKVIQHKPLLYESQPGNYLSDPRDILLWPDAVWRTNRRREDFGCVLSYGDHQKDSDCQYLAWIRWTNVGKVYIAWNPAKSLATLGYHGRNNL